MGVLDSIEESGASSSSSALLTKRDSARLTGDSSSARCCLPSTDDNDPLALLAIADDGELGAWERRRITSRLIGVQHAQINEREENVMMVWLRD